MKRKRLQAELPYYQRLANKILERNSVASQLIFYIKLAEIVSQYSAFQYKFNYDAAIGMIQSLISTSKKLNEGNEVTNKTEEFIQAFYGSFLSEQLQFIQEKEIITNIQQRKVFKPLKHLQEGQNLLLSLLRNTNPCTSSVTELEFSSTSSATKSSDEEYRFEHYFSASVCLITLLVFFLGISIAEASQQVSQGKFFSDGAYVGFFSTFSGYNDEVIEAESQQFSQ